ncbi:unnamed protein product [Menidia menidia]|uniref:peptidylprolyl isomerase n=1 Tax=Menidia menidia TaxID=238744 RepID=A0A8S4ALJ4_9TELE|nr:unnamed protein product [Menidia menidia]
MRKTDLIPPDSTLHFDVLLLDVWSPEDGVQTNSYHLPPPLQPEGGGGLLGMCVGERRIITMPPSLGYGENGDAGEVPGSAVMLFDIELVDMEDGLPEGYMFIWNDEVSPDLFSEMDRNSNGNFTDYIMQQVNDGKGRLAPGFDPHRIIDNMFSNQDRNGDGKITEEEFRLKADEPADHDEL